MNRQRKIAEKIQTKKADYILAAKGNQKNLKAEIKEYFEYRHKNNPGMMKENSYTEEAVGHGPIEKRSYTQLMIDVYTITILTDYFPNFKVVGTLSLEPDEPLK